MSGKPVKERSDEVLKYLCHKFDGKVPVIGVGGIHSKADADDKFKAGAGLVQVYSGFIYEGPALVKAIAS